MIERYTLPEMGKIWTESAKFQSWLKVEIAACEANFSLGKIPESAMKEIRSNAKFDESRITEIEKEVKHDVIAFLTSVNEFLWFLANNLTSFSNFSISSNSNSQEFFN